MQNKEDNYKLNCKNFKTNLSLE